MRLYEFGPTRSIRVRWLLQELELPFEAISVDLRRGEHRRPEFLAINPAGKVPVLVDGDLVLSESIAILLYLAERDDARRFLPPGLAERAHVYRWLLYAATELEQPLWRINKHVALYDAERRIPAEVANASADFRDAVAVVDAQLAGRAFVVGDSATIADFALAYTLDWANEVKLLAGFANASDYLERMYRRPRAAPRIAAAFARLGG